MVERPMRIIATQPGLRTGQMVQCSGKAELTVRSPSSNLGGERIQDNTSAEFGPPAKSAVPRRGHQRDRAAPALSLGDSAAYR